jgi:hypothetical protein
MLSTQNNMVYMSLPRVRFMRPASRIEHKTGEVKAGTAKQIYSGP